MKQTVFTGSGVAIVTPMYADGSINYKEFKRLLDFQIAGHTDAIVVCGTTGEASTLSGEEQASLIQTAVEHVAGRVPVIAGAGSNDTAHAVWLSKQAEQIGADALLHVTPYYNKTSQAGLIAHFTAVADATDLPVIVYNVPSRTTLNITPATYAQLARHPHIVATKEANGDVAAMAETLSLCGDELAIYAGNDDYITATMSLGGIGVISVAANLVPAAIHDIAARYLAGDVAGSRALQVSLYDLIKALFMDVNPIPVKAALSLMGYAVGAPRLPLTGLEPAALDNLAAVLERHRLLS